MPANKSVFQDALKKASNAAWDQRWDTAIKEYRRALAEFPEDVSARSGLALALQESNKFEQALAEYRVLVKVQPGDPVPLAHVAVLLERMNHKSEACETYIQIADIYQQQKQMNKAVEAWRKASSLEPERPEPHEKLGSAFAEAGHIGPAAREWFALAKLAQKSGDFARAQQFVERTLAVEPDNTQAKFLLNELTGRGASLAAQPGASPVEMARRSALSRLAASVLDEKTPWRRADSPGGASGDVDTLLARAIDAQEKGQTREAIQWYEELIAAGMTRPEVQFNLAILYQNNLRHDAAIQLLTQTAHAPQFAVASHFALGQSYRAQGKVDDALDHYIQAMKIVDLSSVNRGQADQVIRLYESLAEGYRAKGDEASAQRFGESLLDFLNSKGWQDKVREVREHIELAAVTGTPLSMQEVFETPEAQRVIALMRSSAELMRAKKLYAAGELAYQALELAPNYLPAHVQVAEITVAAGRINDALAKYDMLAETAEVRRDLPKAIAFYRQALNLGVDDVARRAKLINVLVQSGQLTEAIAEYEIVGQALASSGQLQKAADKYAEGLAMAERAGVVGEAADKLRLQLALTNYKLREYDKALALFQAIQRAQPEENQARYYLVELYYRRGQVREAENELNALMERIASSPQELQETLTALADAFPDNVRVHRELGQLYVRRGEIAKAVELLDGLGDRLLGAGKNSEAIVVVQDIIALNPPQVSDYRRLLLELREPQAG
ncbi:MAG: tetratricopeptide repeat protein [Chloroflexi bacterium]|nr:tetratricopeptide repeat protein [Chloroflexota bacterium]